MKIDTETSENAIFIEFEGDTYTFMGSVEDFSPRFLLEVFKQLVQ